MLICFLDIIEPRIGVPRKESPVIDGSYIMARKRLREAMYVEMLNELTENAFVISYIGEGLAGVTGGCQ